MNLIHLAIDLALAYLLADKFAPGLLSTFRSGHEVDKITAGLKRTEQRLLAAFAHHAQAADDHRTASATSALAADQATLAASQAARVADKVTALLA